jgi:hypothetical protein
MNAIQKWDRHFATAILWLVSMGLCLLLGWIMGEERGRHESINQDEMLWKHIIEDKPLKAHIGRVRVQLINAKLSYYKLTWEDEKQKACK